MAIVYRHSGTKANNSALLTTHLYYKSDIRIVNTAGRYVRTDQYQTFWFPEFIWDLGSCRLWLSGMDLSYIQFQLGENFSHKFGDHCSSTEYNNLPNCMINDRLNFLWYRLATWSHLLCSLHLLRRASSIHHIG